MKVHMVVVNREELAWAAGFFDGEGSVCSYLGQRNAIQLTVTQIHRATLDRFRASVGGIGHIYGPYLPRSGVGVQPQWTFKVATFEQVQAITALLWIWLTPVKREQASKALTGWRSRCKPKVVQGHGTDACFQRGCSELVCLEAHRAAGRSGYHRRKAR